MNMDLSGKTKRLESPKEVIHAGETRGTPAVVACIAFKVRIPAVKLLPFARGSTDMTHKVVLFVKDSVSFTWTKGNKKGTAREEDS
jgi:hypothetical protein